MNRSRSQTSSSTTWTSYSGPEPWRSETRYESIGIRADDLAPVPAGNRLAGTERAGVAVKRGSPPKVMLTGSPVAELIGQLLIVSPSATRRAENPAGDRGWPEVRAAGSTHSPTVTA